MAATLAIMLAGCKENVVTRTVTREVDPPAPTIIGTWTTTEQHQDADGVLQGTSVVTLTFTKSRAIQVTLEKDAAGREIDRGIDSYTWNATDTTVTRTRYAWDDENDRRMKEPTRLAKNYSFADGDTLFINPWRWSDPTDAYWNHTRVDAPIQDLLSGTWVWDCPDCDWADRVTISFSGNLFTRTWAGTDDGKSLRTRMEGSYNHDVENGFILLTISTRTYTENGVPVAGGETEWVGHTLRMAYAPTERTDIIAVSPYVREQKWNQTTRTWDYLSSDVNDDDFEPYGDYHRLYKRLSQTN